MKIEKIKILPNGKYRLTFDNEEKLTTYDDVIIINHLLYDNIIDQTKLNQIQIDTSYYDVYYKVVKFINFRIRSEKEIEEYLNKVGVIEEDKEKIISQLKNIGLINDYNFTKAYINDKFYLTNFGPYKIKQDLINNNIPEDIIDELIKLISKSEIITKLDKLIKKKIISNKKQSSYMLKQKLLVDFINMGYEKNIILDILAKAIINDDLQLNKEYNKMYNKLSSKYSGNDLYLRIKKKLCARGFDIHEVTNFINEKIEIN